MSPVAIFLLQTCVVTLLYENQVESLEPEYSIPETPEELERLGRELSNIPSHPDPLAGLLYCYSCYDCPNVTKNTHLKYCQHKDIAHAKCVTFALRYKLSNTHRNIRGCASDFGTCKEIEEAHSHLTTLMTLDFCHECVGDLCNSVGRATTALIAIILSPLLFKIVIF